MSPTDDLRQSRGMSALQEQSAKVIKLQVAFETPSAAKDPITYWADCVSRSYRAGIEQFVTTGVALEHALADFQKRDDRHWQHAYSELLKRVKMSSQLAGQFRSIAKNPVLSDRRYHHILPANWTTLREMARLPEPEIKRRIASGEINPQTKGAEVKAWSKSSRNKCFTSSTDPKTTCEKSGTNTSRTIVGAHAEYLKLDQASFITEIINLIADRRDLSQSYRTNVLSALREQAGENNAIQK